jgi:hypothetical protein
MRKLNQKGTATIVILVVILFLGLIGFACWRIWDSKSVKESTDTNNVDNSNAAANLDPAQPESNYVDKINGFTFNFEESRQPDLKIYNSDEFMLRNVSGRILKFSPDKSFVITTSFDDTSEKLNPVSKVGDTDIYAWQNGDAGVATNAYVIQLKNGKILTATYKYTYKITSEDGSVVQEGNTEVEISSQKSTDLKSVQTFKYL